MLILLPPSEGKSKAPGTGHFDTLEPRLASDAEAVLRHVDRLKKDERGRFYGVRDAAKAAAMHSGNKAALRAGCVKALERYTGVVYQHLDYPGLKRRKDADKRLLIVSGFFGVVSGATMIPYYKMPINTWLARHWLPINAARLAGFAGTKPVLSLLPQAYAKAVPLDGAVPVDFRTEGGRKSAGHFGKAIKGRFVRWLIENRVNSTKDFGGFDEDGYRFDGTNFIQR